MGIGRVIKKGVKAGFNPRAWIGLEQMKASTKTIGHIFRAVFKDQPRESIVETFEQAVARLGLTEADLKKRMRTAKQISYTCGVLAVLIFMYCIYLLVTGQFLSGLVALMLTTVTGVYALREHFNLYQMRQRRLGCSIQEYAKSLIGKGK